MPKSVGTGVLFVSPISTLAPKNPNALMGVRILLCRMELERPLRKRAGGMFLGRGRVSQIPDASGTDVDGL